MPDRVITRIDSQANPETLAAIQHVMDREGVDEEEAVRRLVEYGDKVVYQPVKLGGAQLLLLNHRRLLPDRVREVTVLR